MKVGPTGPRMSPPSVRRVEESRPAKVEAAPTQTSAPREISDSMTIMGIPEVELTPRVRQALMTLMEEVQNLRRDLQRTSDRLAEVERLADQDTLTPTANRRAFVRELSRAMSQAERYGTPASVVYFDIDSFKDINDTHGHAAGDAVLMHVVDIVMRHIRDTDVVGHLGGDEFDVILSHADDATTMEKAEALVSDIRTTPLSWQDQEIYIEVSYGASQFEPGDNPDRALAAADQAMYAQKRNNRQNSGEAE